MQQLVRNAQRANVNIYSIDPTGLPPPDPKTGRLRGEGLRDFLLTMSNQSGGRAIVLNNEPYREVPAIFAENGSYYLLGYRSTDQTQDGKLRAIEVRVNRPDVDVRARRGYIAPGGRTRPAAAEMPALDGALSRLIPSTGIPIDVSIAPFASATKGQVALVLSMTVGAESVKGPLELAMVLFDEKGEPALTQSGTVPASAFAGGSADLMVPVRFDVKPGRYGVRVSARDASTQLVGSVFTTIDAPDLHRGLLSLSGVAFEVTPAPRTTSRVSVIPFLPFVPTSARKFRSTDEVHAFLRIYQAGRRPPRDAVVTTRIVDAEDRVAFEDTETIPGARFAGSAAEWRFRIPSQTLAPGTYLLRIQAASPDARPVAREVPFSIGGV
jgi:hypothetical protein